MTGKDKEVLKEILSHCDTVGKAVKKTGDAKKFAANAHLAQSCAYSTIRIGEAVKKISAEVRRSYMFAPWSKFEKHEELMIKGGQDDVFWQKVWEIATTDVPSMGKACGQILDDMK